MTPKSPVCPYGHGKGQRPLVVVLALDDRNVERRIGGYRMTPRVIRGVDVHCPQCHLEGWVGVDPDWNPDSWPGPKECSCGVRSEMP